MAATFTLRGRLTPDEVREVERLKKLGRNAEYIEGWLKVGRRLHPERVPTDRPRVKRSPPPPPKEASTMTDETVMTQVEETDMTAKTTSKKAPAKKKAAPKKAAAPKTKAAPKKAAAPKTKAAPKKAAAPKTNGQAEAKPRRGSAPRKNTITELIVNLTKEGKDVKAIGHAVAKHYPESKFAEEVNGDDFHAVRWYQRQAVKRGWLDGKVLAA